METAPLEVQGPRCTVHGARCAAGPEEAGAGCKVQGAFNGALDPEARLKSSHVKSSHVKLSHVKSSHVTSSREAGAGGVIDPQARLSRRHQGQTRAGGGRRGWRRLAQLAHVARGVCELPLHLSVLLLRGEDYSAMHGLWPLSGRKRVAWSEPIALESIKRIKNHHGGGCSVNDVGMAAATGALARYLEGLTAGLTAEDATPTLPTSVRRQLRAACGVTLAVPFNMRTPAEMGRVTLTNKFAVAFVRLPLAAPSPRDRLADTVRAMAGLKASTEPFAMWASLQAVTRLLPATCAASLVDLVADSATAICTNNRGPSEWLYFDGRLCTRWVSWAPQRASIGLCLTLYTYAGSMRCSVSADETCVPEPAQLVEYFVEEVNALVEAAVAHPNDG